MIREIRDKKELENSVKVIRKSFSTVAKDFGLTEENCPTNPAFITLERLENLHAQGAKSFALCDDDNQIGFVAVENADGTTYYLEKLAVLPEHRRQGHGKRMVEFVLAHVRKEKGEKVSIGIMDNNHRLKNWYKELGFIETGTRQFEQLPFTVCFMEKRVGGLDS